MSSLSIRTAGISDITLIAQLAKRIWPICYKELLTEDALAYMLDKFYDATTLHQQMSELQHQFIIAAIDNEAVGFASYELNHLQVGHTKLHKLYVLTTIHGKGIGRSMVQHIKTVANAANQQEIYLHVNRGNAAQHFYEKLGFQIVRSEDIDIGHGYWMNDYLMSTSI